MSKRKKQHTIPQEETEIAAAVETIEPTPTSKNDLETENEALRHILKATTGHSSAQSFLDASGHKTLDGYKKATGL